MNYVLTTVQAPETVLSLSQIDSSPAFGHGRESSLLMHSHALESEHLHLHADGSSDSPPPPFPLILSSEQRESGESCTCSEAGSDPGSSNSCSVINNGELLPNGSRKIRGTRGARVARKTMSLPYAYSNGNASSAPSDIPLDLNATPPKHLHPHPHLQQLADDHVHQLQQYHNPPADHSSPLIHAPVSHYTHSIMEHSPESGPGIAGMVFSSSPPSWTPVPRSPFHGYYPEPPLTPPYCVARVMPVIQSDSAAMEHYDPLNSGTSDRFASVIVHPTMPSLIPCECDGDHDHMA